MNSRVVVVGAGIVGAAIGYRLAGIGLDATVVEAATPGAGTTRTSLAWVNANAKQPRSYFELSVRAMAAWRELADEYDVPQWYTPSGNLEWAVEPAAVAELQDRVDRLQRWGYGAEHVEPGDIERLEPALRAPPDVVAAFFPDEAFVDGAAAVEALVRRAQGIGMKLVVNDPVTDIDLTRNQINAVRLASGERLPCDVLVCAAGWRSNQVTGLVGAAVPLLPPDAPSSEAVCLVATTPPMATGLRRVIHTPVLNLRPASDQSAQLEAGDVNARIDSSTPQEAIDEAGDTLIERARRILPGLTTGRPQARLCVRPLPVDGLPIVGLHPAVEGLYLAVMHSGITLAPLIANLVAHDIVDGPTPLLDPYRPGRFV